MKNKLNKIEEEIRNIITDKFKTWDIKIPSHLNFRQFIKLFFEYQRKIVHPSKYKIFESDIVQKFTSNNFDKILDYEQIKSDLTNGACTLKYLSKSAIRSNSDNLLFDWDIYHFHVESELEPDGRFVKRDTTPCYQLFFMKSGLKIYFIKIVEHLNSDDYSNIDFLEIVNRNWPEILEPYRIKGAYEPEIKISQEDRHSLRKVQINSAALLTDGTMYMGLGMGFSSLKGSSVKAQMKANQLLDILERCNNEIQRTRHHVTVFILQQYLVFYDITNLREIGRFNFY